jgi:P4 family phage/plasmid primase-like protien
MIKISELNLRKLLLNVIQDETKTSGKRPLNIIPGWNKKTLEELNEINKKRAKEENNQYFIMLNREYMVIDTDEERAYNLLVEYLEKNKIYEKDAVSLSYRAKTKNIYYKRHFWFKVNNQKQFKHIKEEGQIDFLGGEIFFGNSGFIGEWRETELYNIPEIDINIYNDIYEILTTPEPILKSFENEKIEIDFSDDDTEGTQVTHGASCDTEGTQVTHGASCDTEGRLVTKNTNNNNEITLILEGLNEKRYLKYDYWITTYFIFLNENINLKYFDDFSRKSPNYNKYNNDKILKSITPKKGYTIATLYFWLKEDNPTLFKELCKSRNDFWNLQINNICIADFYFQLNPDSYIYTYNEGWYEYNENNILIHRGETPISLTNGFGRKLQEIATEQRNFITPDHPKYSEYMKFYSKFYKNVSSTSFITSCIEQLKLPYYRDLNDKINNINLLSFNNVVYDFKQNEFRTINKNDYITKTTGYDLNYNIINNKIVPIQDTNIKKEILNFIYSLFENNEMVEYWLNIIGSSLFGNQEEQKIYIFSGKGSNGKSLTQKIINASLGNYYNSLSNNFLTGSTKKNSPEPELVYCQGVRYLSISEPDDTENKKFNVANLKNWSGGDIIKCRGLYSKNLIEYYPQFTLFINCNDLPELSNIDDGIKRRIRNVYFPFQFKEQKELNNNVNYRLININLSNKLLNPEYIQNFILLLLEHANKNKNKLIFTPKLVLEHSNKYCDENNILYEWFNANIISTNDENDIIRSNMLFNDYNNSEFCVKKLRPVDFSKLMDKLNIEKKYINKIPHYTKIKFNISDDE